MTLSTRIILILMLMLPIAGALSQETSAQETTTSAETSTATETETTAAPAEPPVSSQQTRADFSRLIAQHPSEVARILVLDPALLSNDPFLARYPDLADFIAKHPEIRRNPHYYLGELEYIERRAPAPFEEAVESISVAAIFLLLAFVLAWLVRTIIEQKRWNRLSKTQAEVHNKILDRFGTTSELLEYVKTPAGTKFLESAPIPLHEARATPNAPLARVLWSIQIGVVLAVGALGMLLVSFRFEKESAEGLFAIGLIGFSIGVGFIASALVSLTLSRRLGLWKAEPALDESEPVR